MRLAYLTFLIALANFAVGEHDRGTLNSDIFRSVFEMIMRIQYFKNFIVFMNFQIFISEHPGYLKVWSGSILGGFEINGEFVGSQAGAEERFWLDFGESVTHVQYGVGYNLKFFMIFYV